MGALVGSPDDLARWRQEVLAMTEDRSTPTEFETTNDLGETTRWWPNPEAELAKHSAESDARQRSRDIQARIRADMQSTLAAHFAGTDMLYSDDVLDALVSDAMHHIDLLLTELP